MVAKLIVPAGPLGRRRDYSPPVQSRVIALELHLPAGIGNNDFCYTPPLGNRLILYSVDVWAYCAVHGLAIGGFFYLMFGTGIPATALEITTSWNPIIPLSCGIEAGFNWFHCDAFHRHFSMAKLFTADELRFAVTIVNAYNQAWQATVAFEISEG